MTDVTKKSLPDVTGIPMSDPDVVGVNLSERKQSGSAVVRPLKYVDSLELMERRIDGVNLVFHNAFRLLVPVRRRYRIYVNELILLNGVFLYHKYVGPVMARGQLVKFVGYFNLNKIKYYIGRLESLGYIETFGVVHGCDYYRITPLGLEVIQYFTDTYQAELAKWLQSHNIEP